MNTRLASLPRSTRRGEVVGMILTALVWVAAMALIAPSLETPAHVDRITIDNPHPWPASVAVNDGDAGDTGDAGDGWVGVGGVGRELSQSFDSVLDQGDTWVFRFAYGPEQVEIRVSRSQLDRDDWRVRVPDDLAARLGAAGVPEAPP